MQSVSLRTKSVNNQQLMDDIVWCQIILTPLEVFNSLACGKKRPIAMLMNINDLEYRAPLGL
jgi:hypothetical protein